jgi:hypothetical protein
LILVESRDGTLEIVDQGMSFPSLHDHIIILDFINKALLDSTLVCGPHVLKPKQHSRVAVGAEWCNEGRLDLIILVESDLVVTRVAIKKGQELATGCGINGLIYAR